MLSYKESQKFPTKEEDAEKSDGSERKSMNLKDEAESQQ